MELQFVKMHGIGNDFVLVDCMGSDTPEPGQLARTLCRRRFGIGADGLLAVCPSDVADYRMRIFNADGSEAAICGNGLRCGQIRLRTWHIMQPHACRRNRRGNTSPASCYRF